MLPHLRHLTYRGHWAIPIVAPQLAQLAIEDIRLPEILQAKHLDGPSFIESPNLIQLSLSRTILPDLAMLHAPQLKDLALRSMMKPNTDEGLACIWSCETEDEPEPEDGSDLFPALSILRLEDLTASFTVLRNALECLSPQLRQLHFKNCLLPRTFFRVFCSGSPRRSSSFSTSTFASASTSTSPARMPHSLPPMLPRQTGHLCPSLESMTIVVHENARGDKDVIRPALLDVVHMRKTAGLNLNSLMVDWDESGKTEELY